MYGTSDIYGTNDIHGTNDIYDIYDIYNQNSVALVLQQLHNVRGSKVSACGPCAVVLCICGPAHSGRESLAKHIRKKVKVERTGMEVRDTEIVKVHTLNRKEFMQHSQQQFVAVMIVCAVECTHADVTVSVVQCLSPSKLLRHMGIKLSHLYSCQLNMASAMAPGAREDIDSMHGALFNCMYTKRCRAGMRRVAADLDFLSTLTVIDNEELTQLFLESMPHVRMPRKATQARPSNRN